MRSLRRRLATRDPHVHLLSLAVAEYVVASESHVLKDVAREGVLDKMERMAMKKKTPERVRENVVRLVAAWSTMEETRYLHDFDEALRKFREQGIRIPSSPSHPLLLPRTSSQLQPNPCHHPSLSLSDDPISSANQPPTFPATSRHLQTTDPRPDVIAMPADFLAGPRDQARQRIPRVLIVSQGQEQEGEIGFPGLADGEFPWSEVELSHAKEDFARARDAAGVLVSVLESCEAGTVTEKEEVLKGELVMSVFAECRAAKIRVQQRLQQVGVASEDPILFDGLAALDELEKALARLAVIREEVKRAKKKGKAERKERRARREKRQELRNAGAGGLNGLGDGSGRSGGVRLDKEVVGVSEANRKAEERGGIEEVVEEAGSEENDTSESTDSNDDCEQPKGSGFGEQQQEGLRQGGHFSVDDGSVESDEEGVPLERRGDHRAQKRDGGEEEEIIERNAEERTGLEEGGSIEGGKEGMRKEGGGGEDRASVGGEEEKMSGRNAEETFGGDEGGRIEGDEEEEIRKEGGGGEDRGPGKEAEP
ncbi:hypothetical protein CLOM_g10029 [Closterium sp. NIES-68]|nr:hypothetical protein CLOM_g10029 [Closterium sp. NIES-68]GJP58746.1 hypothetical protein CLOP_g3356 [Closterium sp. NIES-67]